MSWFLAFAGFAALIILHEFGHFLAAKAVGMRVEKFSLFFGPMFAKFQRGETTYGIGPIPLGGYVKITGMNPLEEVPAEVADRAYFRQPVWKRVVTIAAGPVMNILIAFLLLWGLYSLHGTYEQRYVGAIEKSQPAYGALKLNDKILSVDGQTDPSTFQDAISSHTCAGTPTAGCKASTPVTVVVERKGTDQTLKITPVYDGTLKRARLGFSYGTGGPLITEGPVDAAGTAVSTMWSVTTGTVSGIVKIFYNSEARKNVSGVVGSYETTRQSFELNTATALFVLAFISLSLAIVNLFPFLPLDGGHIFWALAEKLRGRPIAFVVMERAGFVGFALVAVLFLVGFTNDIGRLTGDGFGVR